MMEGRESARQALKLDDSNQRFRLENSEGGFVEL